MSGGGGQFIGINGSPHQQRGGGGGGEGGGDGGGEGSVYSTGSGGYSYTMQPLGGDGPDAGPSNRVSLKNHFKEGVHGLVRGKGVCPTQEAGEEKKSGSKRRRKREMT